MYAARDRFLPKNGSSQIPLHFIGRHLKLLFRELMLGFPYDDIQDQAFFDEKEVGCESPARVAASILPIRAISSNRKPCLRDLRGEIAEDISNSLVEG